MVIAGFATALTNSPYEFEISAVLRGRFGDRGLDDGRGTPGMVSSWLSILDIHLTKVALLLSMSRIPPSPFYATVAGLNSHGIPEILQVKLIPVVKPYGAHGELFPVYEDQEGTPITAESFQSVTEGIDFVAKEILSGRYSGKSPAIKKYLQQKKRNRLNRMSLEEMRKLAIALFEETEKAHIIIQGRDLSVAVGGPVQIGVFPSRGRPVWTQQTFEKKASFLQRTALNLGGVFSGDASKAKRPSFLKMADDFTDPLSVPFHQIFAGSEFLESRVLLDGNIFVADTFDHCVLQYRGGAVAFFNPQLLHGCLLEVLSNEIPPPLRILASACQIRVSTQ